MSKSSQSKWRPISFYCENCKMLLATHLGSNGCVKIQCSRCGVQYKKRIVSDTHSITESFAPYGERLLCMSDERKSS